MTPVRWFETSVFVFKQVRQVFQFTSTFPMVLSTRSSPICLDGRWKTEASWKDRSGSAVCCGKSWGAGFWAGRFSTHLFTDEPNATTYSLPTRFNHSTSLSVLLSARSFLLWRDKDFLYSCISWKTLNHISLWSVSALFACWKRLFAFRNWWVKAPLLYNRSSIKWLQQEITIVTSVHISLFVFGLNIVIPHPKQS